jgi:hypothetical protein
MRMRRTAALALCGLLFSGALAACGGDDDDSGDVGLEEVTDDAGGDQAPDDTADEADQDDGSDDEPTTIDDIPGLSEECQVFVEAASAFSTAFTGGGDSDLDDVADQLDEFADDAPDAISDDVQVLADAYRQFADVVGDLDLTDPDTFTDPETAQRLEEAGQIFDDPQVTEASNNLEAFADANCANG